MIKNVEAAEAWDSFWHDLVVLDGQVSVELVANELLDYLTLIKSVAQVYPGITCGQVTNPMTVAEDVIQVAEECSNALVDDALALAMTDIAEALQDTGNTLEQRVFVALALASSFASKG